MKITNYNLLEMNAALAKFEDKKLPQKITFAIMKNLAIFAKEQKFYQDALNKILSKYSEYYEKDEDGNVQTEGNGLPVIQEEHVAAFYEEINELLVVENEINLHFIDKDAFEYDDPSNRYDILTAKETFMLMSLICPPEEDEENEKEAE